MIEHMLWVEKYRPRRVDDTILPAKLKAMFTAMVKQGQIPTLLLSGRPGVGKTTVARALLEELGHDYIIINGSLNGNIDTLRHDIQNYASTVSMTGGRKYVIIDEADFLNPNSFQPALRNFLEQFSKNCGFILTCNYPNRILKEIKSRCSEVEFTIPEKDRDSIAAQYLKKAISILEQENIAYDKEVVAKVIVQHFPDFRRILGELQSYSTIGSIDSGILHNANNLSVEELVTHMKAKNFTQVRKWVGENQHIPPHEIFRRFYDLAAKIVKPSSVPLMVMLIAKYQYQAAFVMDQEINTSAALAEMMVDVEFS